MGKGLYHASYEHDACGVGMVVNIHGNKSHELVDNALKVLENMRHRGVVQKVPTTKQVTVQASCCRYLTSLFYFKVYLFRKRENTEQDWYFYPKTKSINKTSCPL